MELIFEISDQPRQCGNSVIEHGYKIRCTNMTSRMVSIPKGLHYFDGKLALSQSKLGRTIPICDLHQVGLLRDFDEIIADQHG